MKINYKKFMVATGYGEDPLNDIVAFDKALKMAGIQNCNLVPVSSMLAENAKMIKFNKDLLETGEIVFCVLSRNTGGKGNSVYSGLGVAQGTSIDKPQMNYGFVLEAHGKSKLGVTKALQNGLKEMARIRRFKVNNYQIFVAGASKVKLKYGCAVSILVYR